MSDDTRIADGPPSTGPSSRRFTVRDAMLLVVAAALGAWGYRVIAATMAERESFWGVESWVMLCAPGLAALTAGLAVARLLPPRPPRVELFRQPGFAAACVALALTARCFLDAMVTDWIFPYDDWFLAMEWAGAIEQASLGILTAWPVLALAGCLKAERGWIDRSLRVVAVLWVVLGLVVSRLGIRIEIALFLD